ncbi:DGQHR domain-containing protein [Emticicia fluvialis]|uniref:DGQHR domain-containing protein n=1 Tax=Emticicia fluvialis TaxID=2974474 RepID=UPI0021653E84|nr:DNA sulfur modification protein DndB [Emticicia fluvialis]
MKIPAIRGKIGNWEYYISTLTFQQVNDHVSRVDDELHKSESLRELIQRSISKNFVSIKTYILNQSEFFFNSLVLAVYNDYPEWIEIEVKYDNFETYQIGLLDFPSQHKIFPVDGQHRVEGIKAALAENPSLANMKVSVIFIGHKNDENGLKRTRRLFSTLNRYAKPVTMDDIIALDEDDSIAIVTRDLLELHPLFTGKKVTKSKNKAIANDDKDSFTSIITLYECNRELLKCFRKIQKSYRPKPSRDSKSFEEFLKIRPDEEDVQAFLDFCFYFWNKLLDSSEILTNFASDKSLRPAEKYRNNINGGNLLFRPVGLFPFIQSVIEINKRTEKPFEWIFNKFSKLDFTINQIPWRQVLWNDYNKTMIMGNKTLTKQILIYIYQQDLLKATEKESLIQKYAHAINFDGQNVSDVLMEIK